MATIFDPIHNELYFASKGKGAYLNGKKIHCSSRKEIDEAYGCLSDSFNAKKISLLAEMADKSKGKKFSVSTIASTGVVGMYIASGRRDWFVSMGGGGVWDYAAPALICKEAGCKITNWRGEPWKLSEKELIIANKYLHPKILDATQILHSGGAA